MCHEDAGRRSTLNPAFECGAIHAAMYIGKRDAAETIGNVSRAANTQNLDVSIVVVDRKIANYIPRVDTPKRSCDVCGGRASQRNCAIAARNCPAPLTGSCGTPPEPLPD